MAVAPPFIPLPVLSALIFAGVAWFA